MKFATMLLGVGLLVVTACGSSADESASNDDAGIPETSTFASADGVVSVVVPAGAAPASFIGSAERSDVQSVDVGPDFGQGVLLAYELGTSGATFSEPVAVTFRISPSLGNFNPALGLPMAGMAIEDGDDSYESASRVRWFFDGEDLVVEGSTDHFSRAIVIICGQVVDGCGSVALTDVPPTAEHQKDLPFGASVIASELAAGMDVGRVIFSTTGPLSVTSTNGSDAAIVCTDVGPGTVGAQVYGSYASDEAASGTHSMAAILVGDTDSYGSLEITITCVEPTEAATSAEGGTASALGRNDDPVGDVHNMADSTQVEEGQGESGIDITHVEHVDDDSEAVCFVIEVAGDGESAAADSSNHLTTVEAFGPSDEELWQARLTLRFGEVESEIVWLGPKTSGRDKVEGATVTQEWTDPSTARMCVDAQGIAGAMASFLVKIDFFGTNGNYYDIAEGTVR